MVHRDVKASNVLLDAQWNAKLGDFALARLLGKDQASAAGGSGGGLHAPAAARTVLGTFG